MEQDSVKLKGGDASSFATRLATDEHSLTTMILRPKSPLPLTLITLFFLLPSLVSADDDPFSCHIKANSLNFDLTKLAGEHTASRTRDTPPTTMLDSLRFDLCEDLKTLDGVAEGDQVCIFGVSVVIFLLTCGN
jgi:hypothetical protein